MESEHENDCLTVGVHVALPEPLELTPATSVGSDSPMGGVNSKPQPLPANANKSMPNLIYMC